MSTANPTPLRVGAQGTLNGRRYTVAGRVVMSVEVDGETYYWNEFNLVDEQGDAATLVFEEGDEGPEWKLFTAFEPMHPMTAEEAAEIEVDDKVNLDGTPVAVTLVDESRVVHIEGQAPEGVEVGDVANYFNADTGVRMLVASWTGDEIEFYQGVDVPGAQVAKAFGLPQKARAFSPVAARAAAGSDDDGGSSGGGAFKAVLAGLALVVFFAFQTCSFQSCSFGGGRAPAPPPKQAAPAARLVVGARGALAGQEYTVAAHAVVEIAAVAGKFDRHEYHLVGAKGESALLVHGLTGPGKEWCLLRPATPPPLNALEAAALRKGNEVTIRGVQLTVAGVFQSRTLAVDGQPAPGLWPTAAQYGLVAGVLDRWVLARWTEAGIQIHDGRTLAEPDALQALIPPAGAKP